MTLKTIFLVLISFSILAFEAKLERIRGNVTVNGVQAVKGMKLAEGNTIEAKGKKSLFIVRYSNGAKYMLRNGKLILKEFNINESKINLISGKLITSIKNKTYKKDKFIVKTRTASLGVRGTKFWILESPKDTYLCVCEGTVSASNKKYQTTVKKNEDLHIGLTSKLDTQSANTQMLDMALEDFREMGEPVE